MINFIKRHFIIVEKCLKLIKNRKNLVKSVIFHPTFACLCWCTVFHFFNFLSISAMFQPHDSKKYLYNFSFSSDYLINVAKLMEIFLLPLWRPSLSEWNFSRRMGATIYWFSLYIFWEFWWELGLFAIWYRLWHVNW